MDFFRRIEVFLLFARQQAEGGVTIAEAGEIATRFMQMVVEAAADLRKPGPEKKQLVMEAVGKLFDQLEPLLPYPFFLRPFRGWLITPMLRQIVLAAAGGAVEAIYLRLKETQH